VVNAFRLAINTAQFGRTFQDRSHRLVWMPRPVKQGAKASNWPGAQLAMTPDFKGKTLYNLNVRGKRGNIVQTFPSVEYDFVPNLLTISDQDLVHFQWTGSNTHNNGNPAGDGQAGDAGEGTRGTDRQNVVELPSITAKDLGTSFPVPASRMTMFKEGLKAAYSPDKLEQNDNQALIGDREAEEYEPDLKEAVAIRMAFAGYYLSRLYNDETSLRGQNEKNLLAQGKLYLPRQADSEPSPERPLSGYKKATNGNGPGVLLNDAHASYAGQVLQFNQGHYNFMCTRNNNFSNRDQKGVLIVTGSGLANPQ